MSAWQDLSLFGRLATQWDAIHPYNAAQLLRVGARVDAPAADEAWQATLAELGVGKATLGPSQVRHEPLAGGHVEAIGPELPLPAYVTQQMNARFACDGGREYHPFRPILKHEGGTTWLGVIYHHPIADSVSIRLLMREWTARLLAPELATRRPLQFLPPERQAPLAFFRGLRQGITWATRSKQARRLHKASAASQTQRCLWRCLPEGAPGALYQAARARGAKVGDLLLASLAASCDRFLPPPMEHRTAIAELCASSSAKRMSMVSLGLPL
jgi:hypothetical protein